MIRRVARVTVLWPGKLLLHARDLFIRARELFIYIRELFVDAREHGMARIGLCRVQRGIH